MATLPPPCPGLLCCWDLGKAVCLPSTFASPGSTQIHSFLGARTGLALPADSPNPQLSCFSAQRVHTTTAKRQDLRGLCVAVGAWCTPLGVLLSRPSSRCHPWERWECWLSQGLRGRAEPWVKPCWELGGRPYSLLRLSARPGQLRLSPGRPVYPRGTTWIDGRGAKFNSEGQG